jgi:hypothetical protein
MIPSPVRESIDHRTGARMSHELAGFAIDGTRATYRPVGRMSFKRAVAIVRAAMEVASAKRARELLVDIRELTGFASPDTFERFLAAVQWAEVGAGRLRVSMVARPEMIDPQKFGVLVAANRGLVSNAFSDDAQARAWLDANPSETR